MRLPGWTGQWTTPEPWRFLIDLAYDVAKVADVAANAFEKNLRRFL